MHTPSLGTRTFIPLALAGAVLLGLAEATPVAAAGPTTEAQQIIGIAVQQRGDPWRYGATGPSAFDCSGLVVYAFGKAGDRATVGGGRLRSARAIYRWYQSRGLASRSNPKPGDLVVWGGGTHIGIYIGRGRAVSTLTSGVAAHGVFAVSASFTAYLHTGMSTTPASGGSATVAATTVRPPTWTRFTRVATNLRTGPRSWATRRAVIASGTRLLVTASRRDADGRKWFHVWVGGRSGWVAAWLTR